MIQAQKIFLKVQLQHIQKKVIAIAPKQLSGIIYPKNPRQQAHIQKVYNDKGILDRSNFIVVELEKIAAETLTDIGLDPEDYPLIVVDDDEFNASVSPENVIHFNWGTLKLLAENNLLTKNVLKFILGHESDHILHKLEKVALGNDNQVIEYPLTQEYHADEKALHVLNEKKNPLSPLIILDLFHLLQQGTLGSSFTATHPHSHRRSARLYYLIKNNYTNGLHDQPVFIPKTYIDNIKRSEAKRFKEELYSGFNLERVSDLAKKAKTQGQLENITNLYRNLCQYQKSIANFTADFDQEVWQQAIKQVENAKMSPVEKFLVDNNVDQQKLLQEVLPVVKQVDNSLEVTLPILAKYLEIKSRNFSLETVPPVFKLNFQQKIKELSPELQLSEADYDQVIGILFLGKEPPFEPEQKIEHFQLGLPMLMLQKKAPINFPLGDDFDSFNNFDNFSDQDLSEPQLLKKDSLEQKEEPELLAEEKEFSNCPFQALSILLKYNAGAESSLWSTDYLWSANFSYNMFNP